MSRINSESMDFVGLTLKCDAIEVDGVELDTTDMSAIADLTAALTASAAELNILDGCTATFAELNYLDLTALGTGEASKAVVLDAAGDYTYPATATITMPSGGTETFASGSTLTVAGTLAVTGSMSAAGNTLTTGAGAGITGAAGAIAKSSVVHEGGIVYTRILIDLTDLNGGGTAGDIIGKQATAASHFGRLTTAQCGTILGGRVSCLETPAGSNVDVDVWSADESTGTEDAAISGLTNEQQLINHGNWAAGEVAGMVLPPLADQYVYLTSGAATDATFTAGQFLLEFWGYV